MKNYNKLLISIFSLLVIIGCASGSAIITGTRRPFVPSMQVKIYIEPPNEYEIIGIVEASSDVEISSQAAQDRAINEIKKQAGKIGANGILLTEAGEKSNTVGFVSGGLFYAGAVETKVVSGKAIYVEKNILKENSQKVILNNKNIIDVLIEGIDDGKKTTKQQDRDEALMNAKLQAIERSGVSISAISITENSVLVKDWIETKSKAILLPGFQIIDKGYQKDGTYLIILSGKIKTIRVE